VSERQPAIASRPMRACGRLATVSIVLGSLSRSACQSRIADLSGGAGKPGEGAIHI